MTRYAVGDLQGCLDPLQKLLDTVAFDPAADQLWVVGDLINRGPKSLETLQFVRSLGDSTRIVLGNHDLHFLAIYHGIRLPKKGDTLQAVLESPDCAEYYQWLRHLPLLYTDPSADYTMVHAGLAPQWDLAQARALAGEVEAALRGADIDTFLHRMYGDTPDCWRDDLEGYERLRVITNYLTRVRLCDRDGRLDLDHKRGPETARPGFMPWFDVPGRRSAGHPIIVGHWAALLGNAASPDVFPLDTGCVWGREMTMMNLETRELTRCACERAK